MRATADPDVATDTAPAAVAPPPAAVRSAAPDRVVHWLARAAAVMAAADGFGRLTSTGRAHIARPPLAWVHSSIEGALPTWFSAAVMAAVGVRCLRRRSRPHRWWRVVGVLFCCLAIDDVVMLHERVGALLHPALGGHGVYVWVLVLAPVFALLGAAGAFHLYRALAGHPARRALLLAGFAALGVALGFEAAEDGVVASTWRPRGIELLAWTQWCEETLELFGPVLLLGAVRAPRQRATGCDT